MASRKIQSLIKILKSAGLETEAEQVTILGGIKTHLFITDFDGTIFRSPASPALWKGGWWGKIDSLIPPCVPEIPSEDWWIPRVVSDSMAAISEPHTYSVLMTGRQEAIYGERVRDLLAQQGLKFDEVNLSTGYDTVAFKSEQIKRILSEQPNLKTVKILDDRPSYLTTYKSLINSISPEIEVEIELITASSKGALCDEVVPDDIIIPSKASFLGIFLTSESKGKILGRFPAIHDNIYAEHVTVLFKPTVENLITMKNSGLLGKTFDIIVTGYSENEMGQAVKVEVPDAIFAEGRIPHITISTSNGIKPVYSTELLTTEDITPVQDLVLEGIMWWK